MSEENKEHTSAPEPENTQTVSENNSGDSPSVKEFSLGREIWEWAYTIIIALVIAFLIKTFLFDVVKVDGSSMYPTLVNNDRLIITKLGYEPQQGDIIVLDSTYKKREQYFAEEAASEGKEEYSSFSKYLRSYFVPEEYKKTYYVKRIIALPGQTVSLENNKVYVDGEPLEEEYYNGETLSIDSTVHYPITVEENMVFVMGDNRMHSKDSRSSELGQVPFDAILGEAQFRIYPFSSIGFVE